MKCEELLKGSKLETSFILITPGYNLPCKYIIQTVGPIYDSTITNKIYSTNIWNFLNDTSNKKHEQYCSQLSLCYINCLNAASGLDLKSVVFRQRSLDFQMIWLLSQLFPTESEQVVFEFKTAERN